MCPKTPTSNFRVAFLEGTKTENLAIHYYESCGTEISNSLVLFVVSEVIFLFA